MSSSATVSIHPAAVRREADRLAATGRGERFRRRRLEHSKDSEGITLAAITRAKQGDADAIRFEEVRSPELEDGDLSRERARDLHTALDKLPPEQRDVIVMRFVLGLSPREIAERIGRSEDAVHGLQHRGRITLRKELTALQSAPAAMAS